MLELWFCLLKHGVTEEGPQSQVQVDLGFDEHLLKSKSLESEPWYQDLVDIIYDLYVNFMLNLTIQNQHDEFVS